MQTDTTTMNTPYSYALVRHKGRAECIVTNEESHSKRLLEPWESQKVYNHSPDGFEFGYAGSGPAQLALAILLDYLSGDPIAGTKAAHHHQEFKRDFIEAAREGTIITSEQIAAWLKDREKAGGHQDSGHPVKDAP
jgi:hypothetical protein